MPIPRVSLKLPETIVDQLRELTGGTEITATVSHCFPPQYTNLVWLDVDGKLVTIDAVARRVVYPYEKVIRTPIDWRLCEYAT